MQLLTQHSLFQFVLVLLTHALTEPPRHQAGPAAAPTNAQSASAMEGTNNAQAGRGTEVAKSTKGDDLGFDILCEACLGECSHFSVTASPDGRFVAACE